MVPTVLSAMLTCHRNFTRDLSAKREVAFALSHPQNQIYRRITQNRLSFRDSNLAALRLWFSVRQIKGLFRHFSGLRSQVQTSTVE